MPVRTFQFLAAALCALMLYLYWGAEGHKLSPSHSSKPQLGASEGLPEVSTPVLLPERPLADLRTVFDHLLLGYQDNPEAMWREFSQVCQAAANCEQIRLWFEQYLAYKHALAQWPELNDTLETSQQLELALQKRRQLIETMFTQQQIDSLFAHELAWEEQALIRQRIARDPSLSQQQKTDGLNLALAQLPAEQKRVLAPTLALRKLEGVAQQHTDALEAYNRYAADFGYEVAERMQVLHQAEQQWRDKVAEYRALQNTLAQSNSNSQQQQARLLAWQRSNLSQGERRRLQVFLDHEGELP